MPEPPIDTLANPAASAVLLAVLGSLVAVSLVVALGAWRRRGDPTALLLIAGGTVAWLLEPMVDILGACWHPRLGQPIAFTFLDRPMPVWLGFAYTWYFGAQTALCWHLLDSGKIGGRRLWLLWGAMIVSDALLETIPLAFDAWTYYGQQPLLFFKFPVWWAAPNASAVILAAVLLVKLRPHLVGAWRVGALLLPIACYGATSAVVGMPAYLAINAAGTPPAVAELAGVLCFLIDAFVIACLVRALQPPPYALSTTVHSTRAA